MQAVAVLGRVFNEQASVIAFEYVFTLMGIGMLACLPLVLLLRPARGAGDRHRARSDARLRIYREFA